jgi:hypothetical protein
VVSGLAGAYLRQVKRAPRGGRAGFAGRGVASPRAGATGWEDAPPRAGATGWEEEKARKARGGGARSVAARQRVPARSAPAFLSGPPRWLPSE